MPRILTSPRYEGSTWQFDDPARCIGTTDMVGDMVEMVEKHGNWREEAAERTLRE